LRINIRQDNKAFALRHAERHQGKLNVANQMNILEMLRSYLVFKEIVHVTNKVI
jgi:hypothetical protein